MKTMEYFIHELFSLYNGKKIILIVMISTYIQLLYRTRYYFAVLCRRIIIKFSRNPLNIHNAVNVYLRLFVIYKTIDFHVRLPHVFRSGKRRWEQELLDLRTFTVYR
jgi:hypothetical protein